MAIYRSVHVTFWTYTKVVDEFTPEDKYFMLYCLTNNYTNLCGCYEISIKQMSRDLGYNEETIINLLQRFSDIHKVIMYNKQNKELLIKNWFKYNWTKSEKLDKPLLKEIENIKTSEFKKFLVEEYNKRDTVSIPYTYAMDTTDTDTVTVSDTKSDIKKDEQFEQFYKEYPKKVGKAYAKKSFEKIKLTDDLFNLIIINLKKQKEAWEHNKTNKQYIPNPSTWLNQERWNDDILIQETLEERIRRISEQLEKEGKI